MVFFVKIYFVDCKIYFEKGFVFIFKLMSFLFSIYLCEN